MSNFMSTRGKAEGKFLERKELENGSNTFRIVGDILRRYGYWVKTPGGNAVFIECLGFSRELEKFTNKETDHVLTFYPHATDFFGKVKMDKKGNPEKNYPQWAYVATVIDRDDKNKIKELHLKKTMFEDLLKLAAKKDPKSKLPFGDPTDPETGWDITVDKEKTGPAAMNVKYAVDAFSPLTGRVALTTEELTAVENTTNINERHPRMTPDEQLALLESIANGEYDKAKEEKKADGKKTPDSKGASEAIDGEAVNELGD